MKSIFIITTLLTTLSTQKFIANPNYSTWKLKHGKKLSNLNESTQTVQQKSFLENLQIIEQHNKEVSDFELGFNDYSHIAKEDFVKFYCKTALPKQLLPDRPKLARTKTFNNFTVNNLPETFSWRDVLKPVKNQGGVCGSCWAFATMAMLGEGGGI
jgi:C1A family cysteine protease